MATLTASEARSKLYRLIDETAASHQPILITGKRSNAVLVSEGSWRAIQETMYLLSIPGMRDEKLVGDLAGAVSRRINIQPRLVYEVLEEQKGVKIIRMWTHYE